MTTGEDTNIENLTARVADEVQEEIFHDFSDEFVTEWRRRCSRSGRRHDALSKLLTGPGLPIQIKEVLIRFWFIGVADGMDVSTTEELS